VGASIPKPRKPLEWGSWRNQAQDEASDESDVSEGSCPSLFSDPEPPKPTVRPSITPFSPQLPPSVLNYPLQSYRSPSAAVDLIPGMDASQVC